MKKFFSEHPVLIGIAATIGALIGVQILSIPFSIIGSIIGRGDAKLLEAMGYLATAIGGFLTLLVFRSIYKKQGFKGTLGFSKTNLKDVYLGAFIVCVVDIACLIFSGTLLDGGLKSLVLPSFCTFALALAAGVAEETLFRAVPAAMIMKNKADGKRIILAIATTSIFFGLFHFCNMSEGATFSTTLVQVIACIGTGILYAAIYLRSGSIAIPMFLHFFHDLINFMLPAQATGIMTQTAFSAMELVPEVAIFAVELAVGIYLLRKVNFEGIKNTWKIKWSE